MAYTPEPRMMRDAQRVLHMMLDKAVLAVEMEAVALIIAALRTHGIPPLLQYTEGYETVAVWQARRTAPAYVLDVDMGDGAYHGWLDTCTRAAVEARLVKVHAREALGNRLHEVYFDAAYGFD